MGTNPHPLQGITKNNRMEKMSEAEARTEIGRKFRFVLNNNFKYEGKIISTEEKSITIIDRYGREVKLSKSGILLQEEVINY